MEQARENDRLFYILNICIPLVTGAIIYFVFRPDTYISDFFRNVFVLPTLSVSPGWFSDFLRNFACDVLWAYALMIAVFAVSKKSDKRLIVTAVLCIAFEIAIELCQNIGIISGTFDVLDVIFEIIATIVAVIIIKKKIRKRVET